MNLSTRISNFLISSIVIQILFLKCVYSLEYNSLNNYRQFQRISRQVINQNVKEGVYKIQNKFDGSFLTAKESFQDLPDPVVTKEWLNLPEQLWEFIKIDKGFELKPLDHDFNNITSFIQNQAHAYHVWNFKELPIDNYKSRNGEKAKSSSSSIWSIVNMPDSKCIENFGINLNVGLTPCLPMMKLSQQWLLHPVMI